jgi:hypothetical protein
MDALIVGGLRVMRCLALILDFGSLSSSFLTDTGFKELVGTQIGYYPLITVHDSKQLVFRVSVAGLLLGRNRGLVC